MIKGAVKAAEEMNTPIILQIAEVRLQHSSLHLMGPMMVQAAKEVKVDVAVHLDHGLTLETVKKALELGFTSCLTPDASRDPFEENIKKTKEVVKLGAEYGATVEAELVLWAEAKTERVITGFSVPIRRMQEYSVNRPM